MSKVLVLGGGPSGLLAAWGAMCAGHEPEIIDRNPLSAEKWQPKGAFFLHDDCRLPLRETKVQIIPVGTKKPIDLVAAYRKKVYGGENSGLTVSIPPGKLNVVAYDGGQAVRMLGDILWPHMKQAEIGSWDVVLGLCHDCEWVINTIPLNYLLPGFKSVYSAVRTGEAPEHESYMLYNANPVVPWYRASAVFGKFALEYIPGYEHTCDGEENWVGVTKVLPSSEAMPEKPMNLLLTGRYGAWDKSKMAHSAFYDTFQWLP